MKTSTDINSSDFKGFDIQWLERKQIKQFGDIGHLNSELSYLVLVIMSLKKTVKSLKKAVNMIRKHDDSNVQNSSTTRKSSNHHHKVSVKKLLQMANAHKYHVEALHSGPTSLTDSRESDKGKGPSIC